MGIGAMLKATKYEEIWPLEVLIVTSSLYPLNRFISFDSKKMCYMQANDCVHLSNRASTNEQILVMEKVMLGKPEWTLTVPTPSSFVRLVKASLPNQEVSIVSFLISAEAGNPFFWYCLY